MTRNLISYKGLQFDRKPEWPQKRAAAVSEEDKERYRQECELFINALKQRFHTSEGQILINAYVKHVSLKKKSILWTFKMM